jgi:hypothetical protein
LPAGEPQQANACAFWRGCTGPFGNRRRVLVRRVYRVQRGMGPLFSAAASKICRVIRTGRWSICRGLASHLNGSPLLAIASQIDLHFPAAPGVDFSRVYGTQKVRWSLKGAKDALAAGASRRDAAGQGPASALLPPHCPQAAKRGHRKAPSLVDLAVPSRVTCRLHYPLTSGQPPPLSGRKASAAGMTARSLAKSPGYLDSFGFFTSSR